MYQERFWDRKLTRRQLLQGVAVGAGGLTVAAVVGCEEKVALPREVGVGDLTLLVGEQPETFRPLTVKVGDLIEPARFEQFDIEHVKKLLTDLQSPSGSVASRYDSLINNLVAIQRSDRRLGTAVRICASGYYLTAAHLLFNRERDDIRPLTTYTKVYHPLDGSLITARNFIIDPETDLAILYAPSGKRRKRIDGIQIARKNLEIGEKLWQLGMMLGTRPEAIEARAGILFGRVAIPEKPNENYSYVKGMIPFGSSSGGPIVDVRGVIVAIESDFYIDFAGRESVLHKRENYTGSSISPLTNLDRLLAKPAHSLPGRFGR